MQPHTNKPMPAVLLSLLLGLCLPQIGLADDDNHDSEHEHESGSSQGIRITSASWSDRRDRLSIEGEGAGRRANVQIYSAAGQQLLGSVDADKRGRWDITLRSLESVPCRILAEAEGASDTRSVRNAPDDCDDSSGGTTPGEGPIGGVPISGKLAVLAANDLGMHCADQDYRVFSILPPYNVINAQVIEKGQTPRLLSPADGIELTYTAIDNNVFADGQLDLIATDSITTTSQNDTLLDIFKTNFWEPNPLDPDGNSQGFLTYNPLYPTGVLGLFPFEPDVGLPAPDLVELYYGADGVPDSGDESLVAHQSAMPGVDGPYLNNDPQPFHGYVEELPFFIRYPFGYSVENFKRFTAEGIPILPVDDQGRNNAYPLYRVEARDSATSEVLAQVDVVLPVASEADCQQCHASQSVCDVSGLGLVCDDIANRDPAVTFIDATLGGSFSEGVPGETPEQQVINAAKINILRLHDAKHGTLLDMQRNVVCASCHYSPALDLAHLGPNDDNNKRQTQHKSMSRVMHASHGNLNKQAAFSHLFPDMPPPQGRDPQLQEEILQQACYNCHPGKRTKCLRGAMGGGGIVCQDCHGQMAQVGNDFTANFPSISFPAEGSADLGKRVPWANEPLCQSCHVGDVLQVAQLRSSGELNDVSVNPNDNDGNRDDLRLNLAYNISAHSINGGNDHLELLNFSDSRFASNKPLYRLSGGEDGSGKGHGGLSCEGCHGSTHAIWPNRNVLANDNATAVGLQGHTGTIIECSVCHEGDLGNTLDGPHGMHPVGDTRFSNGGHEDMAERDKNACRACHGQNGEGSVLSRTAVDRTLRNEGRSITLTKGTPVRCDICHGNEL